MRTSMMQASLGQRLVRTLKLSEEQQKALLELLAFAWPLIGTWPLATKVELARVEFRLQQECDRRGKRGTTRNPTPYDEALEQIRAELTVRPTNMGLQDMFAEKAAEQRAWRLGYATRVFEERSKKRGGPR